MKGRSSRSSTGSFPARLAICLTVGIVVAQYLCGLATVTSASRMAFAFARDGGLPCSAAVRRVSPAHRTPAVAIWTVAIAAVLFTVYTPVYSTITAVCVDLPLHLLRPADGARPRRVRPVLDGDGSVEPRRLVSAAGRR